MPPGHSTHSDLEQEVCETMRRQGVRHEHGSLRFRVRLPSGGAAEYRPAVVARRGSILFLVEPVQEPEDASRMALLASFLEQHSPEIVLIVLVAKEHLPRVPPDAYDEVYDASQVATVVRRIRRQDPEGLLRPFRKPGPGTGL